MIILDTNLVSEPLRPAPDVRVVSWLNAQPVETLFLTTITIAELRFGVAALPQGKRRDLLTRRLQEDVLPVFDGRILTFDEPATIHYATLRADARAKGWAVGTVDAFIAAIAAAHGFAVASRDTAPFEAAGLPVIDPFAK